MTNHLVEIFRSAELFRDLDDRTIGDLVECSSEKWIRPNEILFVSGEQADGLYLIAQGSVRAFRTAADGREQIIHVGHAVTTIAEPPIFDDGCFPSTVAAEEKTQVFFLPKNKLLETCYKHPELALAGARLLARRVRQCAALVESLSLREVGQRLAEQLLREAEATGTAVGTGYEFIQTLTHNQLATRIGTVREVVTRILIRLQHQGLIIIDGKRMTIPDVKAMAAYAKTDVHL